MKNKKILYIGNKPSSFGGTVATLETLSHSLTAEGYTVITASSKKSRLLRLLDMLSVVFRYRNEVSVVLIDTYSTLNFHYAVLVASLCRFYNIPYIPLLHGGNLPYRLEKSPRRSRKLFTGAKTNVAPSAYLLNAFTAKGYTNLTYIPNTLNIADYPFLHRKEIKPNLLWVRSFAGIYNPRLALQVLEQLLSEGIEASLCMVGPEKDGSLARCKAYAGKRNLPVCFPGKLSKEEWTQQSEAYDIFINTTHFDNMPVSVMEAMALGLVVVSTNVGGLPYLIDHEETGILVPPDTVSPFVKAVRELTEHPGKGAALAANAREKVEQFNWQLIKEKWFALLDD